MDWFTFLAINLGGFAFMFFLIFGGGMALMASRRGPSVGAMIFLMALSFAATLTIVGLNIYHLIPFLQEEEKDWLPIIMWGLAAVWWLFGGGGASASTSKSR